MTFNIRDFVEDQKDPQNKYQVHYRNEKNGTVIFILPEDKVAIGFKRKSKKIAFNVHYKDLQSHALINNFIKQDEAEAKQKELRAAEKKAFIPEVEIGDIFHTSWGYDQTNNNFYQVVGKNNRKVMVRELKQKLEYFGQQSLTGKTYPLPNEFYGDEILTKIIQVKNTIKIDESRLWASIIKPTHFDEKNNPVFKGLYFSQHA